VERKMRAAMKTTSSECSVRGTGRFVRLKRRGDAGQALVELILIMPVFSLLILGAAEFGQLAYFAIEISNAARAGVQYGAQSATTAADIAGMKTAALNDAPNVPTAYGLTATPTQFCTCSNDATSTHLGDCTTAPATCSASGAHANFYVEVQTSATVTPLIHYPGISGGFVMTGQAIMRVE
jgi:Flp pilus assembly protein TadG